METLYRRKQVDCRWREKGRVFSTPRELYTFVYIRVVTCYGHVRGLVSARRRGLTSRSFVVV